MPPTLIRTLLIASALHAAIASSAFALKPIEDLPADIQQRMRLPNYRNHIIAVDEHGSALSPKCVVTNRDAGGRPNAWRVTYDQWSSEDTSKVDPQTWKTTARREFIDYLEGVKGTRDSDRQPVGEDGVFANYEKLYRAGAVDRVIIYIHGGLNFIGSAGVKACELTHAILDDRAYPIFIVWNSNLFGTYGEHLFGVREGVSDRKFGIATSPLQLVADTGTAAARFPLAFTKLIRNDIYQLHPETFQRYRQALSRFDSLNNVCLIDETGQIKVSMGSDQRGNLKKLEDTASWATWLGARASTTPLIDTLGASAWFNMIRRTRVMFERESSFVDEQVSARFGREQADPYQSLAAQRDLRWLSRMGALRYFFERAEARLAVFPNHHPSITVIGHSMGAIVAGEMLTRFPGVPVENLVFMAAACTVNDFKIKVTPYLAAHPTRFFNLCLHSFNDAAEREPFERPEIAPRGSLLVWIDSMFDTPISEDDRTMGRWENAMLATDWLPGNVASRTTIKAFGRDRLSDTAIVPIPYERDKPKSDRLAEPRHHGDFTAYGATVQPSYRFWRPYYWTKEPIKGVTPATLRLGPVPPDRK